MKRYRAFVAVAALSLVSSAAFAAGNSDRGGAAMTGVGHGGAAAPTYETYGSDTDSNYGTAYRGPRDPYFGYPTNVPQPGDPRIRPRYRNQ